MYQVHLFLSDRSLNLKHINWWRYKLQGGQRNWHTFVRLVILSNIDQFSIFSLSESGENFVIILSQEIPPHLKCVPCLHYLVKCQCLKATIEFKASVETHFKKLITGNYVFFCVSQLLSTATVTSCCFYIKCSNAQPCCWTTHSQNVFTDVLFLVVTFKHCYFTR